MSQVKIYQEGGKAPATGQKYTFKINGSETIDLGHEELQSWFNDHMKAGGGKTKNRDEWNTDFNGFLGKVKEANASGQYFDLDLQGDSVGAITAPTTFSDAEQGIKENGKAAKPGLLAGIGGTRDQTARNSSLIGGVSEYVRGAYTRASELKTKAEAEATAKEKAELDKVKAEKSKTFNNRLNGYTSNFLDPTSNFTDIDGRRSSLDYAQKQYHTGKDADRARIKSQWANKAAGEFKSMYDEASADPETLKAFEDKFGKDAINKVSTFGTSQFKADDFLKNAYGEGFSMFTDSKAWQAKQQAAVAQTLNDRGDGTFTGSDETVYTDVNGKNKLTGNYTDGKYYKDGKIANGDIDGLKYNQGSLFDGNANNRIYRQGKVYSGYDPDDVNDYDFTNWADRAVVYGGKRMHMNDFAKLAMANPNDRALGDKYNEIVTSMMPTVTDDGTNFSVSYNGQQDSEFIRSNPEIGLNQKNPYYGAKSELPSFYKDLSSSYTNFSPSKGALLVEYNNKVNQFGAPAINVRMRTPDGKFMKGNVKRDRFGNSTFISTNGKKIVLGKYVGKPKDTNSSYFPFKDVDQENKNTLSKILFGPIVTRNEKGGKLEALRANKFQIGGAIVNNGGRRNQTYSGAGIKEVLGARGNYELSDTDLWELGALAGDVGSLAATFAPGVGNAVAAGAGAVGSIANFGAQVSKDGLDWGDAGGLAAGLALDAATLVPGLGTLAKTSKIAKGLKSAAPLLGKAFAAYGLASSATALHKILTSDEDVTVDDWRQLAIGLTTTIAGKRAGFDKALATTKGKAVTTIKANGERFELDNSTATAIANAKGAGNKADIVRKFVASKMNAGIGDGITAGPLLKPEGIQLEKGMNLRIKGIGIGGKDKIGLSTDAGERIARPMDSANWLQKRAIRRAAMANPTAASSAEVLGTENRLPTAFGQKYTWFPGQGLKRDGKVVNQVAQVQESAIVDDAIKNVPVTQAATVNTKPAAEAPKAGQQTKLDLPDAPAPKAKPAKPINIESGRVNGNRNETITRVDDTKPAPTNNKTVKFEDVKVKKGLESAKAPEPKSLPAKGKTAKQDVRERTAKLVEGIKQRNSAPSTTSTTLGPKAKPQDGTKTASFMQERNKMEATQKKEAIEAEAVAKPKLKPKTKKKVAKALFGMKFINPVPQLATTPLLKPKAAWSPLTGFGKGINPSGLTMPTPLISRENKAISLLPKQGLRGLNDPKPSDFTSPGHVQTATGSDNRLDIGKLFNKLDASEFGRALFNRNLAKNTDTNVDVPLASNVTEVSTPVKGDLLTQNAYNQAANGLVQNGSVIRTSDGMLQLAGQLANNKQAADLRLQGAGANAEAIARSEAESVAASRQYAAGRQQTANANAGALAAKSNAERQGANAKANAMGRSLDNFWASQNQRGYMKQDEDEMYDREIAGMSIQSEYGGQNAKVLQEYNTAATALQRAQAAGDEVGRASAQAAMDAATEKGNRIASNIKLLQLKLGKDSNYNVKGLDILSDLSAPSGRTNTNGFQFINRRPGLFASGGKISAEDKLAIQTYKDQNKALLNDTKEYNKWLSLRIKEDKKEQTSVGKSIDSLIKAALKTK